MQVQVMLLVESKLQSLPHVPQLVLLTRSTHFPPQQPGCMPAVHLIPQPPQFIASPEVSMHAPLQHVVPPEHAGEHDIDIIIIIGMPAAPAPPSLMPPAPAPPLGAPAAGIPAAGIPAAGIPAAGIPAAGIPAAGIPAAGIPAAGIPAAGTPAAGIPAAGVPPVGTGTH
jgi:hypothetical protein